MSQKILYIDDEPRFVSSLIEALQEEEYVVITVTDGTKAIDKLRHMTPDLIILDIIMPTGEGVTDPRGGIRTGCRVHEIIRNELGLKTPIIFVTVVDDPATHREIKALEQQHGIQKSTIMTKPVLPSELLERVEEFIGKA